MAYVINVCSIMGSLVYEMRFCMYILCIIIIIIVSNIYVKTEVRLIIM